MDPLLLSTLVKSWIRNICLTVDFERRIAAGKKEKQVEKLKEQLMKLEVQATDREENKEIALGTSKLNYLDPRISVAWWDNNDSA